MRDETETYGSRRHVDLKITAYDGGTTGVEVEEMHGAVMASADYECDLEIELRGVCGNHVVRINLSDPHSESKE